MFVAGVESSIHREFNTTHQICCGGQVHNVTGDTMGCCGGKKYDTRYELCCKGEVRAREHNNRGEMGECCLFHSDTKGENNILDRQSMWCNFHFGIVT